MLSKLENKVMLAVLSQCNEKQAMLISPTDLINLIGQAGLSEKQLDEITSALSLDGYFDLVYSNRHGERIYCITLLDKGKAFVRSERVKKRNLLFRIGFTAVLAIFSFLIGVILKAIFT